MRTAFPIGIFVFSMIASFFNSILESDSTPISSEQHSWFTTMLQPAGSDGASLSIIMNAWNIILYFLRFVFCWYPTLWAGQAIYVWYIYMALIAGFVLSLVLALRGTSSS